MHDFSEVFHPGATECATAWVQNQVGPACKSVFQNPHGGDTESWWKITVKLPPKTELKGCSLPLQHRPGVDAVIRWNQVFTCNSLARVCKTFKSVREKLWTTNMLVDSPFCTGNSVYISSQRSTMKSGGCMFLGFTLSAEYGEYHKAYRNAFVFMCIFSIMDFDVWKYCSGYRHNNWTWIEEWLIKNKWKRI